MPQSTLLTRLDQQRATAVTAGRLAAEYTDGTLTRTAFQDAMLALHSRDASVRFLAEASGIPRGTLADHLDAATRR